MSAAVVAGQAVSALAHRAPEIAASKEFMVRYGKVVFLQNKTFNKFCMMRV